MKGKKGRANRKDVEDALIKKAVGFDVTEVVEEYVSGEEGEIKLSKKKITTKNVPPDVTAIKMCLDGEKTVEEMTDEELEQEKQRLLSLLSSTEKNK